MQKNNKPKLEILVELMNFGLNSETIEYIVGLMDNNKRLDFYESGKD